MCKPLYRAEVSEHQQPCDLNYWVAAATLIYDSRRVHWVAKLGYLG